MLLVFDFVYKLHWNEWKKLIETTEELPGISERFLSALFSIEWIVLKPLDDQLSTRVW